jgi:hypothetical protein
MASEHAVENISEKKSCFNGNAYDRVPADFRNDPLVKSIYVEALRFIPYNRSAIQAIIFLTTWLSVLRTLGHKE